MVLSYYHKKTPINRGKGSYVLPPPHKWIDAKIQHFFNLSLLNKKNINNQLLTWQKK